VRFGGVLHGGELLEKGLLGPMCKERDARFHTISNDAPPGSCKETQPSEEINHFRFIFLLRLF
jgi:hypothetical protein